MRYYMAMGAFLALIFCGGLSLLMHGVYHAYFYIPERELKRRAARGRQPYKDVWLIVNYGVTARVFLQSVVFVLTAATVIMVARAVDPLVALVLFIIYATLFKIVAVYYAKRLVRLAARIAPYVSVLLRYLDPLIQAIAKIIRWRRVRQTTDIYDKEDLKEIITNQKFATNNQIDGSDLDNVLRMLEFSDKTIAKCMVKREDIHFVTPKDPIGPILLSELHKSGYTCFPVKGNAENEIVGMLQIRDLVERTEGGVVSEAMSQDVVYVREDQPLFRVAQAFVATQQHVFMVINKDDKLTGLITVRDLLEQLLGKSVKGEFEEYGDRAAVST